MVITKDLGAVSAYAYAVEQGYQGTEEEFAELMARQATVAEEAAASADAAAESASEAQASAEQAEQSAQSIEGDVERAEQAATTATNKATEAATSAATANGAAQTATGKAAQAEQSATAAANSASAAATSALNAASSATAAQTAQTAAETAQGKAEDAQAAAEAAAASIDPDTLVKKTELEDYARIDGSYETMTVGNAEQLVATVGVDDNSPYNFRTSGGSVDIGDRETVNAVVGGTVAWNQLVKKHSEGWDYGFSYSGAISYDGDTVINTSASAQKIDIKTPAQITFVSGHKYFVSYDVKCSEANGIKTYFKYSLIDTTAVQANTWTRLTMVRTTSTNEKTFFDVVTQTEVSASGVTLSVKDINIIDLTQMFGSTIADYIYSLEQATAGAGVSYFRKLFPEDYYAYNSGELLSVNTSQHKMVGFNQWDEEWEQGAVNMSDGSERATSNTIRSKNYCGLIGGNTYYATCGKTDGGNQNRYYIGIIFYDAEKSYISGGYYNNLTFTAPENARYFKLTTNTSIVVYGSIYNHDICINLSWDGERDGEYEPYKEWVYPLDSSLTLRGIPKLDASNNLYYDGDTYAPDGTVTRKYGVVDLGTETWYKLDNSKFYCEDPSLNAANDAYGDYLVCTKYLGGDAYGSEIDKIIAVRSGTYKRIWIRDSSFENASAAEFKESLNGVYLVYALATPTTETATPYTQIQSVDDFGTEEYTDYAYENGDRDVAIPVGNNTVYSPNLRAKLEMSPNSPDGDGLYVVEQSNGQNEYVPLVIPTELPPAPSEDGTYTLKITVSGGTVTKSWIAEE